MLTYRLISFKEDDAVFSNCSAAPGFEAQRIAPTHIQLIKCVGVLPYVLVAELEADPMHRA